MFRAMFAILFLVLAASAAAQPYVSTGNQPTAVVALPFGTSVDGVRTNISSTNSVAKAPASAATNTSWLLINHTTDHSLAAAVTCTASCSLTVTLQGSWDGVNAADFYPAVTVALAPSSTVVRQIAPVSLPVTPFVRAQLSSDATYPCTYTYVGLLTW
jgi:hypothetical protein